MTETKCMHNLRKYANSTFISFLQSFVGKVDDVWPHV